MLDATLNAENGYSVRITGAGIPQVVPIDFFSVVFWGDPGDPSHDPARMLGALGQCPGGDPAALDFNPQSCNGGNSSDSNTALVTLPSDCSAGPVLTKVTAESWQDPGDWKRASFVSHGPAPANEPIGVDGCDRLAFDPSLTAQPTTTAADAPTGLDLKLAFDSAGLLDPGSKATPPLKKAVVTLPEGMTVNPAAADGLGACSDAELGLGTDVPVGCPASAKIGSVSASTPLLEEELGGSVYVRSQRSG